MKMMGLPGSFHWLSWFLLAFLSSLFTIIIILILLVVDFKVDTLISLV